MYKDKMLAIMQPYFLPYLGYFSLMHNADAFILFDVVEYDRKGWMNRNRILKPGGEDWQYIRAGVEKPPHKALIRGVKLVYGEEWKKKVFGQLEHYKKVAPFYEETMNLIREILSVTATTLTELNKKSLALVRDYLSLECPISIFSKMNIEIPKAKHAGQWALLICEVLKAKGYVNPIGGKDLFRRDEFEDKGIEIHFVKNRLSQYPQASSHFIEGLSIIDVLMFNTREQVIRLIKDYEVLN